MNASFCHHARQKSGGIHSRPCNCAIASNNWLVKRSLAMKASTHSSRFTAARFVSSQGDDPVVYATERGLPGDMSDVRSLVPLLHSGSAAVSHCAQYFATKKLSLLVAGTNSAFEFRHQ